MNNFCDVNLIKVLTGIRRCAKSILLTEIKKEKTNSCIPRKYSL